MKYWVINMVRKVQTRTKRALSPTRHRFKHYLLDGKIRLVRNRPQPLREEWLEVEAYRNELWELQENGIIEVRIGTTDGPRYEFGAKAEEPEAQEEAEAEVVEEEEVEVEFEEEDAEEEVEEEEKPLGKMNKKELQEKYEEVFGEAPDPNLTKRELVEMIEQG